LFLCVNATAGDGEEACWPLACRAALPAGLACDWHGQENRA